jgi:beta-glucanase (GH16 family)
LSYEFSGCFEYLKKIKMKKYLAYLLLILCNFNISGQYTKLVWSDEFVADTVDESKWNFEIGNGINGWGNNELEYYTSRPENVYIDSGKLVIKAIKENYQGFQYTSTRMQTKNKGFWKYGRIEMRAKLPQGKGTWPAFWMMPQQKIYGLNTWPDNGEIDIMEYVGFNPGTLYGTVHVYQAYGGNGYSKSYESTGLENDFHIYAIEWSPDTIKWFFDNHQFSSYLRLGRNWQYWPFDQNFYIIVNFAVGGNWGGSQGIDTTIFPQTYQIDYIRVYQSPNENIDINNWDSTNIFVSPNPVKEKLRIVLKDKKIKDEKILVYDLNGKDMLAPVIYSSDYTEVDFTKFTSGSYVIKLQTIDKIERLKVVKL